MMNRRTLLGAAMAALATTVLDPTAEALAHHTKKRRRRKAFKLAEKYKPQTVAFSGYAPGTIVVDPRARFLYLVETRATARRYGVGVGRAGLAFRGSARVGRKAKWPRWTPTKNMMRRNPRYRRYAKGVPGGPRNPLGARAIYLYRGKRDTMYRIHGTTAPWSIGQAVSNGCVRMLNDHVKDLYNRVSVGARVVVL
ncbi:MAG: L,D-transpeptidase [Pseudomonadota bacterium]